MAMYRCGLSGGTELKYKVYRGATTLTITCKEAYLYAAGTTSYPVVSINNTTQTPIEEINTGSYSHDRIYHFANLNKKSISISLGRGSIFYY